MPKTRIFELTTCTYHGTSSPNKKIYHYKHRLQRIYPRYYKADADRIKQVLLNLLNNAIKFTASGTITLVELNHQDWPKPPL